MWKNLLYFLLIIIIIICQISFLSQFVFWHESINLILVIVILSTLWRGYKIGIITAIVAGLFYDIYSVFTFGTHLTAFLLPVVLVNSLFKNLLANKSMINLVILTVISTLSYYLSLSGLSYLLYWLNLNNFNTDFGLGYAILIIKQVIFNTLLLILIFNIVKFLGSKLRARFLIPESL